jgi:TRAP-type C4-dicarboxylate transport system permease small subunit
MTMPARSAVKRESGFWAVYAQVVRILVFALEIVAAIGILTMMLVTCAEVILRIFRISMTGVIDLVCVAAAVSAAAAMPYTTACKGHVAIEYFFQKLSRFGRAVVDTFCRLCVILLFGFLSVECISYGMSLRARGQVTPTLQMPEFWVPYVLAASCVVVCLVTVYHLFHPGKELIKP